MNLLTIRGSWAGHRSERQLIKAAQSGNRESYDALIRSYEALLRGFLRKRNYGDAVEDIMQEVWIAGWRGIGQLQGDCRFKQWIFKIALRKCVDHYRGSANQSFTQMPEQADEVASGDADFAAAVDLEDAVRCALETLPEAQREVVELYFYADLTLAEVAESLGRNLNTVKYQFYQANVKMATALKSVDETVEFIRK